MMPKVNNRPLSELDSPLPVKKLPLSFALTILGLFLSGCATRTVITTDIPPSYQCLQDDTSCYADGERYFAEYVAEKESTIQEKGSNYTLPSLPTSHLRGSRKEYAVLLIHGLNDSAYYMSDLTSLFGSKGFNAISILLPGHGTDTRDMLSATVEDWRKEVDRGIRMANMLGEKLIIVGFSLGATLAIDAMFRGNNVHALYLFSPALEVKSRAARHMACFLPIQGVTVKTDLPENPVKYKHRTVHSVCQLNRLIKTVLSNSENISPDKHVSKHDDLEILSAQIKVPTFIAYTFADVRITTNSVYKLANNIDAYVTLITFGEHEQNQIPAIDGIDRIIHLTDENLPHSYLLLESNPYNSQFNPKFKELADEIDKFIHSNIPLSPVTTVDPVLQGYSLW